MESLTTHPANAQQAKAFTAPTSLSYPGGAGDLTPPSSEKDGQQQNNGVHGFVCLVDSKELMPCFQAMG